LGTGDGRESEEVDMKEPSEAARKKAAEVIERIDKYNKRLGLWCEYKEVLDKEIAAALEEFAAEREKYRYDAAYKLEVIKREREKAVKETFARLEALMGKRSLCFYPEKTGIGFRLVHYSKAGEQKYFDASTLQATVEQAEKEIGYGE